MSATHENGESQMEWLENRQLCARKSRRSPELLAGSGVNALERLCEYPI
jgi:hypothetical protein